uniref:ethanolamine-phosphate cytidylyltransferase n=1 Tax=Toxoplasma gondii COUG TaxID=1074873 RepID=A0A2G8XT35_TOXGO|nr:Phosphoethanolamine-cytidyltransferase [Toxoplasma gondii COUG]
MTAVASSEVLGPARSGALPSSPSKSWSSPFISSSYLHKLIFLYLRINADETLSAKLRHWPSVCCHCSSRVRVSLPHAAVRSSSHASSVSSLTTCATGNKSACSYCGAGAGGATEPMEETEDADSAASRHPCCFCCCVKDPKWTAEADAEFSALRAHLLQFVARSEASPNPGETSPAGETAETETPGFSPLSSQSTGENRMHASSRDCSALSAPLSGDRAKTDKKSEERDAGAGAGTETSEQTRERLGRLHAYAASGLRSETETQGSTLGSGRIEEEQKITEDETKGHRGVSPLEQETLCSEVVSPCDCEEEATPVAQVESDQVTPAKPACVRDASVCTHEQTRNDDGGVPDTEEHRVQEEASAFFSGEARKAESHKHFSVCRGPQSRAADAELGRTNVSPAGRSETGRGALPSEQADAPPCPPSSPASSFLADCVSGRQHVSLSPLGVSSSSACVDSVPAYHWNALPLVLPVPSAFSSFQHLASPCASPSSPVASPSSPVGSPSAKSLFFRPSPSSGPAEETPPHASFALAPVAPSPQLSPFPARSACAPGAPVRIYVDGVFDLLHSGHFNALRQARQLGGKLVVGVCSDAATFAAKKVRPIYTETERAEIVRGCKWVDEVIVGTPYEVSVHLLDRLNCAFAAHGDDWVVGADGEDAYAGPRHAGRMKIFKRTEGISTSTIVSRLLQATAHVEQRHTLPPLQAEGQLLDAGEVQSKKPLRSQAVTQPTRVQRFARDSLREQKENLLACSCKKKRGKDEDERRRGRAERLGKRRDAQPADARSRDCLDARGGEEEERGGSDAASSANLSSFFCSSSDEGGRSNGDNSAHRRRQEWRASSRGSDARGVSVGDGDASRETERRRGNVEEPRQKKSCCAVGGRHHRPRKPQDPEERRMLMSTKRLLQFIGQPKRPKAGGKIVYVDGSFDVFHVGHLRILEKAKQLGDYLIVGIHDDETVSRIKGPGFPVLNLHERALNVLAMRVVDEVIIGAPWVIPHYMLKQFQIDVVVRGSRIDSIAYPFSGDASGEGAGEPEAPAGRRKETEGRDSSCSLAVLSSGEEDEDAVDPYRVPKELGVYREVESSSSWTTRALVERILANREALMATIETRCSKEAKFWREQEQGQMVSLTEL